MKARRRLLASLSLLASAALPAPAQLPDSPLTFGAFVARFGSDGSFTLEGQGWPAFKGTWKTAGEQVELATSGGPAGCDAPGRYRFRLEGGRVSFALVSDGCTPRRMIVDRSTWSPAG